MAWKGQPSVVEPLKITIFVYISLINVDYIFNKGLSKSIYYFKQNFVVMRSQKVVDMGDTKQKKHTK